MIEQGTTGDDTFDRISSAVCSGSATEVLWVGRQRRSSGRRAPDGRRARRRAGRLRRYPPGIWVEHSLEFKAGQRWVIIAYRADGGRFRHDGDCGKTERVSVQRYRDLVAYARAHD